jgi:hypothetical protein
LRFWDCMLAALSYSGCAVILWHALTVSQK